MTDPTISVIVPTYNAARTLAAQLDAVLAQQLAPGPPTDWEVVVADNRSTDATIAIVGEYARRHPRLRLVHADAQQGPSHARNIAAVEARGSFLVCCDADDIVAPGWLAAMDRARRDHRFVAGALELDRLNERWVVDGRGRSLERRLMDFAGVPFAHGCNLAIERTLLLEHPFDETMRAGEEVDLALRLHALGIGCAFAPDAVVHYRYRTSARATMRQAYAAGLVGPQLRTRAGLHVPAPRHARRAAWLVRAAPRLAGRSARIRWSWVAADETGQLVGTWRARRGSRRASQSRSSTR